MVVTEIVKSSRNGQVRRKFLHCVSILSESPAKPVLFTIIFNLFLESLYINMRIRNATIVIAISVTIYLSVGYCLFL